nr:helix-turn-helix domain-containing protein [uncultured Albidiferax sp.]
MTTATLPPPIAVNPDPLVQIVRKHVNASAAQLESIRADFMAMLSVQMVPVVQVLPAAKRAMQPSQASADAVLTTEQGAQLLGVSRPYFVKLIDAGQIPLHQKVGNQRRVLRSAVLHWQTGQRASQQAAMAVFAQGLEDDIGL